MRKAASEQSCTPTVSQVTHEAAVVLQFLLKNAADAPRKKVKRKSREEINDIVVKSSTATFALRSQALVSKSALIGKGQISSSPERSVGRFSEHKHDKKVATSSTAYAESAQALAYDEHDGLHVVSIDVHKKFHERTISENEDIFEKVADELARMADELDWQAMSKSSGLVTPVNTSTTQAVPPGEKKRPQEQSSSTKTQATAPAEVVNSLVKDCTYSKFEQVVRQNIGHRVDWGALAQMFRLSQVAVQRVGVNSTAANDIQKFTMRYFQDQFAPWIVEQGGWGSVVNQRRDSNSEVD